MKSVFINQAKNGFVLNEVDHEKRSEMLHVASNIADVFTVLNAIFDGKALAKAEAKSDGNVVQMPAKQATKPKAEEKPKAEPKAEGALDYERDVKPTALQLSRNPALRPKLIEIYKEFGVSVGGELKSEQLADALAAMKKVLAQ